MNAHRDVFQKCSDFTDARAAKTSGMYPYFREIQAVMENQVVVGGRRKIMIGSNNYLGLANDERVLEAAQAATRKFGSGCTGSRFLNGNNSLHEELERELRNFLDKEAVLLFSTGYFANLGALVTLCEAGDFILCDRENHASIIDGCQSSKAKTIPYAHNSGSSLRRRLSRLPAEGGKLVAVDGVFSMSGDLVNLPEVVHEAKAVGARVFVDEAHSLGVFGEKGKGTAHHFGLKDSVDIIMGTFSKSLGSMGGFLAGPEYVIDYLRHRARCMMFTASLAPAVVGGVLKALRLSLEEPERRDQLWKNTRKMHEGFRAMGFDIGTTQSPIVPLLIGSELKAFQFAQMLLDAGIFATPAVYPAVKYGRAIVRTSYTATHTENELDYVLETCEKLGKKLGIFQEVGLLRDGAGETSALNDAGAAHRSEEKTELSKKRIRGAYDFSLQHQAKPTAV